MDVTVSARHTEVPDHLRQVAEEKIGRLDRFLDGMERAEVHFSEETNPRIAEKQVCEVTLQGHGHYVRCEVRAPSMASWPSIVRWRSRSTSCTS